MIVSQTVLNDFSLAFVEQIYDTRNILHEWMNYV